jgi:hypothetical protein
MRLPWFNNVSSAITMEQYNTCVSLHTQQYLSLNNVTNTQQCNQAVIEFYSNDTVDYRLLFQSGVRLLSGLLGSRSSGLVNCSLMMEYTPKCCYYVQANR